MRSFRGKISATEGKRVASHRACLVKEVVSQAYHSVPSLAQKEKYLVEAQVVNIVETL
jgi:hypothetical protein